MAYIWLVLLLVCKLSCPVISQPLEENEDDYTKSFCGLENTCCPDRQEECSFLRRSSRGDTICYCDSFCHRPDHHDDCCPDYDRVCGYNVTTETTSSTTTTERPSTTEPSTTTSSYGNFTDTCIPCNDDEDIQCGKNRCLMQSYIVTQVNANDSLGWRASEYKQFLDKKLRDGLKYKLGTFERSPMLDRMNADHYSQTVPYLKQFDARVRWPLFITSVVDQGWCGSDWAVSLASIISDRFAIQSHGAQIVKLSPQILLSCNLGGQKGCKGGHIDNAWGFARIHGLVEEECFPYEGNVTECPFKTRENLLEHGCKPDRYKVGPPSRLVQESDVMYDIMHSGPIQAIMEVYQDFFHYSSGIYRRSRYGDQKSKGYHSVKLIGWGEENEQKYWLVANSWGPEWGEKGYFRIARGVNESGIESFMVSAICYVTEYEQ